MPEVFTAQEAADYLRIHVDTLYAHARTGAIPARKLGEGPKAQWRFSKAALDAYLLNGGQ